MGNLTLILGGARSGKSTYAEQRARHLGGDSVLYVATSEAKDEEMKLRVAKHRAARPATWSTLEAPRNVAQTLHQEGGAWKVVLVDCFTVLVSNLLLDFAGPGPDPFGAPIADPFDEKIEALVISEVDQLVEYVREQDVVMLLVSNEVGLGVVPPYELGRAYRDVLGRANQILAQQANEVYFLLAGIPLQVK